jgi:CheY-like chemotaxis protein
VEVMKTILIIDDSPDILMAEEMVLTRAGYDVHTALSGQQALKKLKSLPTIDLILLDYEMQPMNGPQFLEAFKNADPERFKTTKITFITAHEKLPTDSSIPKIPKMKDIKNFVQTVNELTHS